MARNKITQVTSKEIEDIINNSVQSAKNRLVGNAAEQKKMFVRPIANTDGSPNVTKLVQRLAKETESAVGQLEKEVDALETPPPPDSLPLMGVFLTYDEDNETLQIVGERGVSEDEVAGIVSEEVAPKLSEIEDKLSDKQDALAIADNYNAETNKVATETTVANELAKIVGGADASFDTLKEIADWIKAHPESVAEINSKIQANAEKISTNETAIANLDTLSKLLETNKQDKTDENLETESKEIVGAINEVNSGLVKGIGSSIAEETNELVLELKGKDGTVLFSTKVQLPKSELPDLSAYVKTEDRDNFVKEGITETEETWTDKDKAKARETLGAVGFNDYATADGKNAGIVKMQGYGAGGISVDNAGNLFVQGASISLLKSRSYDRPIMPSGIENVMWMGVTGFKETWNGQAMVGSYGNQKELSDEEKAIACAWLGVTELIEKLKNDNNLA